jgi:hypothetical protein
VVREKVDDLASAAEQAEQELKMRVDVKQQGTGHINDYVDPTDAVDLPPPSENSPFAFQASALRGLGVKNSLGTVVLAERLPPSSPGVWSLDPDEAWRKALLQEAVDHSLNNTPAHSFHTSSHATTSSGSMGPSFTQSSPSPGARTSTPSVKRNLGQRIMELLDEQYKEIVLQSSMPSRPSLSRLPLPASLTISAFLSPFSLANDSSRPTSISTFEHGQQSGSVEGLSVIVLCPSVLSCL